MAASGGPLLDDTEKIEREHGMDAMLFEII